MKNNQEHNTTANSDNSYIGMWITADGYIRHELLPGGRYDEARGNRQRAYRGQYWIKGTHIEYKDDTGFTAFGDFEDDILYHAGYIFYRDKKLVTKHCVLGD